MQGDGGGRVLAVAVNLRKRTEVKYRSAARMEFTVHTINNRNNNDRREWRGRGRGPWERHKIP